ncbi:MAG: 4-hydroxy-3-methylbut-2-enyl diphosphate reductase [Polynucleobacter sp.]|jgi:4-hydroxy-3-methylbut-2-enyl diphosphate reductase|uniref:4-hydroxy-3-methylbut-2-enyl diphosphate reductase n=1 Tax=Polynucleobacter sp. HIN8 TaxID=3047867 RepID=UPI001DD496E9|nr:4-hydroxy-3-methylbut-2-enyl diphosphate reductase [Polynucleobacter sp. HIN8]MBM3349560.1 4-hydroxy-3-methylbut-2-enyl diphosphate reductase [Betaproteobacteria bacterium]MBU3727040.1 4-hydroxy-3-methylbut-2-enyl diphosphate reductase [Polynucleobacter sp.]MBU6322267.1 4-hydroxy-3-methylbut-2-enyl diphosphate reductase [Burkholderiales bacterium]NBP96769.1 4-hydroxy-3-methylbut-2-enyl diphosphate reductase [Burkholderiaceae bacterium]NCA09614.1 4-hydroxy-3-methylbut-2-enyl diphosphate redu
MQSNPLPSETDEILLAQPRGFCAGVDRAINIVNEALTRFGAPIYVRHEIVHNKYVVDELRAKGAIFVDEIEEIPRGAIVIYSAHGVSQQVRQDAAERGLQVYDATCPLVTKVHVEVVKLCKDGFTVFMIGHAGHPEVEGTMGQVDSGIVLIENLTDVEKLNFSADERLAFVTQTTLSVDETKEIVNALTKKFPKIIQPKKQDICYATQNRQDAVKFMAPQVQLVIVVGSQASSNSNRLRELAEKLGVPAYMVDAPEQLRPEWFDGKKRVGLTAGASAPETLAQAIVARIQEFGPRQIRSLDGVVEDVTFSLPKNLTHPV